MSNETDLDWLARNVHRWPCGKHQPWCYVVTKIDGERAWASNVLSISLPYSRVDKDQWLSRRAELQNKPSWDHEAVPAWATALAQDQDGEWKWLGDNVTQYVDGFTADKIRAQCKGVVLGSWRDTLERRPEEFKPFTSIEDNQEQDMKQDNGWHERGELPPVGMAVQLWHGGTYAYDCELIAKRGNNFVLWNLTWDRPDSADCMMCEFKPIPTERDVLIEIIKKTDDTDDRIADAILAAGFKRGAA